MIPKLSGSSLLFTRLTLQGNETKGKDVDKKTGEILNQGRGRKRKNIQKTVFENKEFGVSRVTRKGNVIHRLVTFLV